MLYEMPIALHKKLLARNLNPDELLVSDKRNLSKDVKMVVEEVEKDKQKEIDLSSVVYSKVGKIKKDEVNKKSTVDETIKNLSNANIFANIAPYYSGDKDFAVGAALKYCKKMGINNTFLKDKLVSNTKENVEYAVIKSEFDNGANYRSYDSTSNFYDNYYDDYDDDKEYA